MNLHLPARVWLIGAVCTLLGGEIAGATAVSRLEVRIVTGAEELGAGSILELRIYEAGRPARRWPLSQGEAWPRDSTHIIPVTLGEPLDPRSVLRFSLYYRPGNALAPTLEIVSAEVELPGGKNQQERLLNATLSGVIPKQGELATVDREPAALTCASDADCDDHRTCNGQERCSPRARDADARGCVKGSPVVCPVNEICSEGSGCKGISEPSPGAGAAP